MINNYSEQKKGTTSGFASQLPMEKCGLATQPEHQICDPRHYVPQKCHNNRAKKKQIKQKAKRHKNR